MKRLCSLTLKGILLLCTYLGLEQLIELKTRGFCLQRIQPTQLALKTHTPSNPLESEIKNLLHQSFHFMGAGSECFAFLGEDGHTVIKFFKLDLFRPVYLHRGLFLEDYSSYATRFSIRPSFYSSLPSPLQLAVDRLLGIRDYRLQRTFHSTHLAYDQLQEQTGLLYLHLRIDPSSEQNLTLYDSCGITHSIDLQNTPFILQQRATPLFEHFETLLSQNENERAKLSIDSVLSLLYTRCQKGLSDRDIVARNFGFLKDQAIEIDTGSFDEMQEMRQKWLYSQELCYATLELKLWLKERSPGLALYLQNQLDSII